MTVATTKLLPLLSCYVDLLILRQTVPLAFLISDSGFSAQAKQP